MSPVAFWSIAGMFALAKVGSFRFFGLKNDGSKICAFMIAIAKRLIFRMATCAIGVFFASFQFNLFGKAGGNFWLVHETLLKKSICGSVLGTELRIKTYQGMVADSKTGTESTIQHP